MSIKLDHDGLRLDPINLTEDTWAYEETIGLSLYHRGNRIGVIPLSTLRAFMSRYNARSKKSVQPTYAASKSKSRSKRG